MNELDRFYQYLDEHRLGVICSRSKILGTLENPWCAFISCEGVKTDVAGHGKTPEDALLALVASMREKTVNVSRLEFKREELPRFEVAANG